MAWLEPINYACKERKGNCSKDSCHQLWIFGLNLSKCVAGYYRTCSTVPNGLPHSFFYTIAEAICIFFPCKFSDCFRMSPCT
mmetsp:Transcript_37603/g.69347  ORF Transcript_37603/g.69347 Transcript_37603/m.69347 type:complete len:82 (-) Transcript_37603:171-416(-)